MPMLHLRYDHNGYHKDHDSGIDNTIQGDNVTSQIDVYKIVLSVSDSIYSRSIDIVLLVPIVKLYR